MPENRITCPGCQAVLKSAQPVPPGKKIKCPKCQQVFAVPAREPEIVEEVKDDIVPAAAVKPKARKGERDPHEADTLSLPRRKARAADDDDERDDAEPAAPRKGKSKNLGVILACVGGGSFALMIIIMALMPFLIGGDLTNQMRNQGGFQIQFKDKPPNFNDDLFKNMPK